MKGQELQLIYCLGAISPLDAWEVIYEFVQGYDISPVEPVQLYDQELPIKDVSESIRNRSLRHFQIEFQNLSFGYGAVTNWEHIFISCENKSESKQLCWQSLVDKFLDRALFIQSWVSDIDYTYWQNADDPLQYESNGRSYKGLPMMSNGLPPPLEQMNIDTSNNPGRRIIRPGYVETIGSTMWLGDEFWSRTGTSKVVAMAEFSNESTIIRDDVVQFSFQGEPFTESSDVFVQEKIRRVLFNPTEMTA